MAYTATRIQTGRPRNLRSICGADKKLSPLHTCTQAAAQSAGGGLFFLGWGGRDVKLIAYLDTSALTVWTWAVLSCLVMENGKAKSSLHCLHIGHNTTKKLVSRRTAPCLSGFLYPDASAWICTYEMTSCSVCLLHGMWMLHDDSTDGYFRPDSNHRLTFAKKEHRVCISSVNEVQADIILNCTGWWLSW